jgi:hypothetical protein
MGVEGVWKVEMKCPFGWGKLETAFLKNGRYLAASEDHYSTGSYEVNGETFTADIQIVQYGKARKILGTKKERFSYRLDAKIITDGKIVGRNNSGEGKKQDTKARLTRLGDLD